MKWDENKIKIKAIESKFEANKGLPQARTYQLCIPDVYVAAKDKKLEENLFQKYESYGVGYISVPKSNSKPKILIEPRKSRFFNWKFYEDEVYPRIYTFLAFYDFMDKCLKNNREEILKNICFGILVGKSDYVWVSDKPADRGIQWSLYYMNNKYRFGLNLESVYPIRQSFNNKDVKELKRIMKEVSKLPKNFIIIFDRRCEVGTKFKPGLEHVPFEEFGGHEKRIRDMKQKDYDFIIEKTREDELVEAGY
ncbi:hypothetical protein ACFL1L_05115, partial [Thermoplasmatota archaeon]